MFGRINPDTRKEHQPQKSVRTTLCKRITGKVAGYRISGAKG
jgi:hypothetical protein